LPDQVSINQTGLVRSGGKIPGLGKWDNGGRWAVVRDYIPCTVIESTMTDGRKRAGEEDGMWDGNGGWGMSGGRG